MNESACSNRSVRVVGLICATTWIFFCGAKIAAQEPVGDLEVQSGFVKITRGNTTFRIGEAEGMLKVLPGDVLAASSNSEAAVYIDSYMEVLKPGGSWTVPKAPLAPKGHSSKDRSFFNSVFHWNPREDKETAVSKSIISDIDQLYAAFPSHNSAILTDRPYLVWDRSNSIYEVAIYHEETLIFKRTVKNRHYLTFPNNLGALKPNLNYYWEVTDSSEPRFNDSSVFTVATDSLRWRITDEVRLLRNRLENNGYSSDMIAIATAGCLHQKGYNHAAVQEIIQAIEINRDNSRLNFIINKLINLKEE